MTEPQVVGDAAQRRRLTGVAYRLLGSLAEAEDAVQEGYARWYTLSAARQAGIASPTAWLTTVVGRICLDMLDSARARRERYVGPWLPEPLSTTATTWISLAGTDTGTDPLDRVSLDESLSIALLTVLERLTPPERVAFVLHDVFGYPFADIAEITGRSPGACRQLASSARHHVQAEGRSRARPADLAGVVTAFKAAWEAGDVTGLIDQLDGSATATVDGGGKVSAALAPLTGPEPIARFLLGVYRRQPDLILTESMVNGQPGLIARDAHGRALASVSFGLRGKRIGDLWVMRNPDKLTTWSREA